MWSMIPNSDFMQALPSLHPMDVGLGPCEYYFSATSNESQQRAEGGPFMPGPVLSCLPDLKGMSIRHKAAWGHNPRCSEYSKGVA
jgi:hypothetical protein